jgi:putative transposase
VSTRKVDDLVAALGLESGISKSEMSRICAGLDTTLEAFKTRTLGHIEFSYVLLDATYVKARVAASRSQLDTHPDTDGSSRAL